MSLYTHIALFSGGKRQTEKWSVVRRTILTWRARGAMLSAYDVYEWWFNEICPRLPGEWCSLSTIRYDAPPAANTRRRRTRLLYTVRERDNSLNYTKTRRRWINERIQWIIQCLYVQLNFFILLKIHFIMFIKFLFFNDCFFNCHEVKKFWLLTLRGLVYNSINGAIIVTCRWVN